MSPDAGRLPVVAENDEQATPDPGLQGTIFLGWLKRNKRAKRLALCEVKLARLGLTTKATVESWGSDKICLMRSRSGPVVVLMDASWADDWAKRYDVEVPHHSEYIHQKIFLL